MASVGSERQLRFRWNDHMQHVSKVLTLQRLEEQFCDVTLVSDDGFVMKAHQAILASTSAYFQRVLSEVASDQYPMIVLRGAKFREMSCLLDYMYQGNTQVDQSLMESVLEVADMLEVKGLSRIRSNTSLKKFMGQPSTTTSSTPAAEEPRSGCRSPEDQFYQSNQQESRTLEAEGGWRRLQGNVVSDNSTSKENVHAPIEGVSSSHTPAHAPCHQANPQEDQDETQTSGIDLSLAKNEPWSPREGIAHSGPKEDVEDDGLGPAKKKRKHESLCSEVTLDQVSDPDWGRIATKLDERPHPKPRTISLTSITTTELGIKSETTYDKYNVEDDMEEYIRAVTPQPASSIQPCSKPKINADNLLQSATYNTHNYEKESEDQPYGHSVPHSSSPKCDQTEDPAAYGNNVLKVWWNGLQSVSHQSAVSRRREVTSILSNIDSRNEALFPLQSERDLVTLGEQDPLRVIDNNIPSQNSMDAYQPNPSYQSTSSVFISRDNNQSENTINHVNQRADDRDDDSQTSKADTPSHVPSIAKVTNLIKYVDMRVNEKDVIMTPGVVNVERQSADSAKDEELLCPLEKKLRRPVNSIKRPMNKYMLFQNSMRPKLTLLYPGESSQNITQRLGKMWKDLPESEKAKWKGKAESLKEEHKRLHPDYSYNPKMAAQLKREYSRARMERRNLYRIHTYPTPDDS
ncbi:longitudinals lacking protein-like isoform X4 [Penaeus japonicus]|uniref:longitudinals lacking protein-like isoform X4 n=1 Tax=Penaeus japonicus TaxID=27405 RepID=UPI001C714A0A|nr:longitudinals lacking protein-like isoform X4 [Penaeus japonicus]